MIHPITEHVTKSARHTSFYLACGPADGTPVIFVHGCPELSLSWRHQLPVLAALGFRAIAPDMRGYGRSSCYPRQADYALEHSVADMIELLDSLGHAQAIWVGHDWGAPVVWSIASHHPARCHGVANLCVPHFADGFAPENFLPLVDREVYPEAEFPAGQWDYQMFYMENFDRAHTAFEADVTATVKALFRKGAPAGRKKPSRTATIRRDGGWFGGAALYYPPQTLSQRLAAMAAVTRDDVVRVAREVFTPERLVIAAVGNLSKARLAELRRIAREWK
jgi:pimeloyl-ACP methyl ester carboxylesterase